ncbi:MAG: hypothetical protein IJX28_00775 [Clostridia bacterium]|nr:hypothetical protein [Clostridia bacterium]
MAKKKTVTDPYSEENIKKNRTFPTGYTVGLCFLVLLQLILLLAACHIDPQPQDVIEEYAIVVEPQSNGTLNMTYTIVWQALDPSEDLTWVEIGMPNKNYSVDHASLSSNIARAERYEEDGYTSLRLYLDRPYVALERLTLSFTVNQQNLLCADDEGRFFELVPGWFNATPVEYYRFFWKESEDLVQTNGQHREGGYVWEGSMPCGSYALLQARYTSDAFPSATPIFYRAFDDSGVWDELHSEKVSGIFVCVFLILLLGIAEVYIVDCYVSYHRGRGFIRGYGYHVHVYGHVNPHYTRAQNKHNASRGGGGGGRGCACACACACAGGGRAGCSQKNTYQRSQKTPEN